MKIQKVETYVLQGLLGDKAFGWSQGVAHRRQTALCLVSTDNGIQGVGEAFYYGGPAKIVAMASAWNIPLIPHVWGTNVGLAASLQFFAALPHFPERRYPAEPFFEFDRSPHPLRDGVTREKFIMKNGYLDIPPRPGLGITLDMDFVRKHLAT
ncbi:MAG: hypothetical protein KKH04_19580 [Proteobacteria bacterium]|nr:hypothetical protein [Pseudomonadota bacterium]